MIKTSFKLLMRAYDMNPTAVRVNLLLAVGLEIISVIGLYYLNQTYGRLYGGIQEYNTYVIWTSIAIFAGIAMGMVGIRGYLGFFINRLAFEIRVGLTHYELPYAREVASVHKEIPNYNQRVQEDFKKFADSSCELWFAILKSGLHLPVFIGVIVGLTHWYIGLAIVVAVLGGTILSRVVAMRLVGAQVIQETNEAEFRKDVSGLQFDRIKSQFQVLNRLFKRLSFTQSGLGQAFVLLPFIVLMPLYLSKAITMGAFFQSVNALNKVIDSLSVLIDSRQVIVDVETCVKRLEPLL